jgi:hypothetical protein
LLTVTCNDQELVLFGDFVGGNIGIGSDDLFLRDDVGVLFEVKVA